MSEGNLAEEILNKILKIAESGAVAVYRKVSRQVRFSVNKIDIAKEWDETTISLLIEKEKKMFVLELSYRARDRVDDIIKKVEEALKVMPPKPYYAPLPEPEKYSPIPNAFDKVTIEHPEKMIDIAKISIDSALKEGAKKVAGAIYTNAFWASVVTSAGFKGEAKFTNTYLDVRAFCNGLETGHASIASRSIKNIRAEEIGRIAAKYAKLSREPKKLKAGKYDAIFTPDAVASLLNFVGMMSSGFAVIAGYSAFTQKIDTKVASKKVTIADNPRYEDSYYPAPFDEEGVATKENILIENGILKTYLHNRITAKLLNAKHTGNAGWLFPHPWNLIVKPGDATEEEMISDISEGLLIGNVTYIRFQDYLRGDFSGIIRDGVIYIKNGEIQHAVKGLRLSDNIINWLQNIDVIGKEPRQIYHWWLEMNTPVVSVPVLVRKANFTEAW
ncbi:MAG: TldD/PmbA family protein [Candidatus Njordarchaeota archaeon]